MSRSEKVYTIIQLKKMADFGLYFPKLLRFEGGFVDDPQDPGGATNMGITIGDYKKYAMKLLGEDPTIENLKAMSQEQAMKIYKVVYWVTMCGDEINDQLTAEIMVDFGINAGIATAVKNMQILLQKQNLNIFVDGICGPQTYTAINSSDITQLYMAYKQSRITYYENLVNKRPSLRKFLNGWLIRTNTFPDLELQ